MPFRPYGHFRNLGILALVKTHWLVVKSEKAVLSPNPRDPETIATTFPKL